MVTREEFTEFLNALNSLSNQQWKLIKNFDKRLDTLYDHRKELFNLMATLQGFRAAMQDENEDTEKWKKQAIKHIKQIRKKVFPEFSSVVEAVHTDITKEAQLAEQEMRTVRELRQRIARTLQKLETEDLSATSLGRFYGRIIEQKKIQSIDDLAQHVRNAAAQMRAAYSAQHQLVENEQALLEDIDRKLSGPTMPTPRDIDSWVYLLKQTYESWKVQLEQEKSRVILPLQRLLKDEEQATGLAQKQIKKSKITREDIAKDASKLLPHEFQKYQSEIMEHYDLLTSKAKKELKLQSELKRRSSMAEFHTGEALQQRVVRDQLTDSYNRYYLQSYLPDIFKKSERLQQPFSVLLFDIDHFKSFNDTYGHPAGDEVLVQVVKATKSVLRHSDQLIRWGGEEFMVILPNQDRKTATKVAERIRKTIEQNALAAVKREYPDVLEPITVSIGVSTYPTDAQDWDALRDLTDRRLYLAKENGRNRVVAQGAETAQQTQSVA